MEVLIRSPKLQDYDRFSDIVDQVQQLHVDWRPDVYKPVHPLITREQFAEILKGDSWYVAEADGRVIGVLEVVKRHVESPSQVTKKHPVYQLHGSRSGIPREGHRAPVF